jgi:hypothetical protein
MKHLWKWWWGVGATLGLALAAEAQPSSNTVPPLCTVANLTGGTCSAQIHGTRAVVTDGLTAMDCVTGGGAVRALCEWDQDNVVWVSAPNLAAASLTSTDMGVGSVAASELVGNTCLQVLHARVDPTEAGATDDFMSLSDHGGGTTEANEDDFMVAAAAGTMNNLICEVNAAPTGTDTWQMTVRHGVPGGLVDSLLTCDITGTATTCTDVGNAPVYAAGDHLTIKVDSSTGATDPAAAILMECSFCLGQ